MIPVPATQTQADMWSELDGGRGNKAYVIGGPEEGDDVIPCPALVTDDQQFFHVAYQLDEIELAALAHGGTLWLTTLGHLPVHQVAVTTTEGELL